jgi:hypothetical protein
MGMLNTFARIADRLGPILMLIATVVVSGATLLAAG